MLTLKDLTEREKALLAYFYVVATDPRIAACGWSFTRVSQAFLSCVQKDMVKVLRFALGKTAEWTGQQVAPVAAGAASTMLGGIVSEKAASQIAKGLGTVVLDGGVKLGEVLDKWLARSSSTKRK